MKRFAPLAFALSVYAVSLGYLAWRIMQWTERHLLFSLDDAYIHMALARTFAQTGIFGINADGFTSASSSPAWTFLLAGLFKAVGPREWVPLVLNIAACAMLLVFVWSCLDRWSAPRWLQYGTLLSITIFTPLALMTSTGMEHSLQSLLAVMLVVVGMDALWDEEPKRWRDASVLGLAFAGVATRYELMAIVLMLSAIAAWRRRWGMAAALIVAGATPIVAFGAYSMANGGFFLPNSIIVKSQWGGQLAGTPAEIVFSKIVTGWKNLTSVPLVALGALLTTFMVGWQLVRRRVVTKEVATGLLVLGTVLAQVTLGSVGWLFRYEAYLIPLVIVALVLLARDRSLVAADWRDLLPVGPRTAVALSVVALVALGTVRFAHATDQGAGFAGVMYTVNWQAARFVAERPEYRSIMVGDLGIMAWLNPDRHITDVEGLAESELPMDKLGPTKLEPQDYQALADQRDIDLAILWYLPEWKLPSDWMAVGVLGHRFHGYLFGDTGLGFYALDQQRVEPLLAKFNEFAPSCPTRARYMSVSAVASK